MKFLVVFLQLGFLALGILILSHHFGFAEKVSYLIFALIIALILLYTLDLKKNG